MKSFGEFVQEEKLVECAALMVALGIDSKAFCEAVESRVRYAHRNSVGLNEAFSESWWNPTTKGSWLNPLKWGANLAAAGNNAAAPAASALTGSAYDVDNLKNNPAGTSWANTGRRVAGTVRGLFGSLKDMWHGAGGSGSVALRRSMNVLGGAVKDIQSIKANLEADELISKELMPKNAPGTEMNFGQVLDTVWQVLANELRDIENGLQAQYSTKGLYGKKGVGVQKPSPFTPSADPATPSTVSPQPQSAPAPKAGHSHEIGFHTNA